MQNTPVSGTPVTTLEQDSFLTEWEDPFDGRIHVSTKLEEQIREEQRERVRLHCVEVFSSSPLYQARAAKDPTYWDNFSTGRINL
jgi:hypothetical protein